MVPVLFTHQPPCFICCGASSGSRRRQTKAVNLPTHRRNICESGFFLQVFNLKNSKIYNQAFYIMHTFLISAGTINNRRQKQIYCIASLWQITNYHPLQKHMIHVKKQKTKNKQKSNTTVLKLSLSINNKIFSNNTVDGLFKWTKIYNTLHHGVKVASWFPKLRPTTIVMGAGPRQDTHIVFLVITLAMSHSNSTSWITFLRKTKSFP